MTRLDQLDPELAGPLEGFMGAFGGGFDLGDITAARRTVDDVIAAVKAQAPPVEGVTVRDLDVPGYGGGPSVRVRLYRPVPHGEALPAIVWLHAGGWVLGNIELEDLAAAQLAKDVDCVVASVEYRLAPEHPFPAALHDGYAVLRWLAAEAPALGVDPSRIAVGGASAGGNLAAGIALIARDQGDVGLALQVLIYPSLDDRAAGPASAARPETLFWSRQNAVDAWTAYLHRPPGSDGVSAYAAPSRSEDLRGLPPAYMPIGALDPFLDENLDYARRLIRAGVPAELHVYPDACHAFDVFGSGSRIGAQFIEDRNAALRRVLHPATTSPAPAA